MCVLNENDEFGSFINSTKIIDDENNNNIIITKLLLLSIPSSVFLISLVGLNTWTTPNVLQT